MLDYSEFTKQMKESPNDKYCFRIVELGIPACDVVVMGKPRLSHTNYGEPYIEIGKTDESLSEESDLYNFRILRGHTVEDLIGLHKKAVAKHQILAMFGSGCVLIGGKLISDNVNN